MRTFVEVTRYVNDLLFVLLALAAWRQYRERKGPAAGWFAGSFGALALVVVAGLVLPDEVSGGLLWAQKLLIVVLLAFPYLLYRFGAAFEPPARRSDQFAAWSMGIVVLATLALPRLPGRETVRPAWFQGYMALLLVVWTALSILMVARLWRAGTGKPTLARRRMRMLASAAVVMNLALVLGGLVPDRGEQGTAAVVLQLLAFASAVLFFVGFAPPPLLRLLWRRPEERALQEAQLELIAATTPAEVTERLLPHVVGILGARAAVLVDGSDRVLGSFGPHEGPESDRWPEAPLAIPLRAGTLLVHATAHTPFFGREELGLLVSLGAVADLALARCQLLEGEREAALALERTNVHLQEEMQERTLAAQRLARSEQQLRKAQEIAKVGNWEWNLENDEVTWSEELHRIFGIGPGGFTATYAGFLEHVHPEDRELVAGAVERVRLDHRPVSLEYRILRPDGSLRTIHGQAEVVVGPDGRAVRMVGTGQDVTERRQAEDALSQAYAREREARVAFERANAELSARAGQQAAVARLGQRALAGTAPVVLMEEAAALVAQVLGVDGANVWERAPASEALLLRASAGWGEELVGQLSIGAGHDSQAGLTLASGDPVVVEDLEGDGLPLPAPLGGHGLTSRVTVPIPGNRSAFGVMSAETMAPRAFSRNEVDFLQAVAHVLAATIDRHQGQEQLAHLALHDPLTGLPNRALLFDRLQQALTRASRHGSSLAVCFLDVDRFKWVNDGLGHTAGDELLSALACRLASVVRATDTVARLGGDEFVVLFEDVSGSMQAAAHADRIAQALQAPLSVAGREVTVTVSMGIVLADASHDDPESLLRDADAAMYRAKERGRARYEFFDTEMRARVVQRLETEAALRRALEDGQLRLVYQPEVALRSGRVVGVEALLRWEHPERGLLPPSEFLPLAEETGLIVPMGPWVLGEACRRIQECRVADPGLAGLVVWVNLSSRQLSQPDLPELVARVLAETGTRPSNLGIEITESALMDDTEAVGVTLDALKELGVQLAIDDFGTGFSSLSYLRRFPVGVLKVDRSFVAGLGRDAGDSAIVRAVVGLAHSLGLLAVAEGVETFEQAAALRSLRCDLAQGYYFGRPVVFDELKRMLGRTAAGPRDDGLEETVPAPQSEPLRGLRVLVCDDDPNVRRVFRTEIELSGALVTEAADGQEAVEIGSLEQPDLVLLDVFMPRRDGMSALPELRSRCPKARVLMVTALTTPDVVRKSRALGAAGCFDKLDLIPHVVQALTEHVTAA